MKAAHTTRVARGTVLADAAYSSNTAWSDALACLELNYAAKIVSSVDVWLPGQTPESPAAWKGKDQPPVRHRRRADRQPQSVQALVLSLSTRASGTVARLAGNNAPSSGRFAAVRVCAAQGDRLRQEEWLLIECPKGKDRPTRYVLSNLPANTPRKDLVRTVKTRWRIAPDYQDLKQELFLDQYEGRGWRGLHHHATLCIAAYGHLVAKRLRVAHQKIPRNARNLPYPRITDRAARPSRALRRVSDSIAARRWTIATKIAAAPLDGMPPHLQIQ